jgi:hypothetical protein
MSRTIAGFPFWEAAFDEEGKPQDSGGLGQVVTEIQATNLTDLFIFSHGWNNDRQTAQVLYDGFFQQVRKVLDDARFKNQRVARCGIVGVFWPSVLWPDEQPAGAGPAGGGAATLRTSKPTGSTGIMPLEDLRTVFGAAHEETLQRLHQLLTQRAGGKEALGEFSEKLASLFQGQQKKTDKEDSLEIDALGSKPEVWQNAFKLLSDEETTETAGGGAGLSDELQKLWDGAKGALRVATYWQMRDRGGTVGRVGLGPFINRIAKAAPNLQLHLIGHSFGARLVSYALAGLEAPAAASPVKSLFLLQGAFSHFAFAQSLPFDATRSGDLTGKDKLVDGPLLTTFSDLDLAVGRAYPLASIVAGQDASDARKVVSRWGGMGSDGAQAVNATSLNLRQAGSKYEFKKGDWYNLDGNRIIKNGGPPSGAHSDIIHPETAWAALSAAGIA